MTEMIQEPNDESEADDAGLIELVDAPPDRRSYTPPPPANRKSSEESKPRQLQEPTMPSPALATPPGSTPDSVRSSGLPARYHWRRPVRELRAEPHHRPAEHTSARLERAARASIPARRWFLWRR
jgi:hypothetical protein